MKRSILILGAVLLLGLASVNAQERDTTATDQSKPPKGMVEISATEIPAPVLEALKGSAYTGWESGDIYKYESSDLYMVEIGEGGNAKQYYFDKNGAPAAKPNR